MTTTPSPEARPDLEQRTRARVHGLVSAHARRCDPDVGDDGHSSLCDDLTAVLLEHEATRVTEREYESRIDGLIKEREALIVERDEALAHIARQVRDFQRDMQALQRDLEVRRQPGEVERKLTEALAEASARCEALQRERDAYKKAKAENDERYMTERDEARSKVTELAFKNAGLEIQLENAMAELGRECNLTTAIVKERNTALSDLAAARTERDASRAELLYARDGERRARSELQHERETCLRDERANEANARADVLRGLLARTLEVYENRAPVVELEAEIRGALGLDKEST
jgi:DNA repair exonuclease SbcCD ATPase subunit